MVCGGIGIKVSVFVYYRFRVGREILVMLENRRYENKEGLLFFFEVGVDVVNFLVGIGMFFSVLRK